MLEASAVCLKAAFRLPILVSGKKSTFSVSAHSGVHSFAGCARRHAVGARGAQGEHCFAFCRRGGLVTPAEGGWQPVAPSAIAFSPDYAVPKALDEAGIEPSLKASAGSRRALRGLRLR